ncbi:MAG: MoaD/ThiS family protein [Proteobacteria bacterium]|jgi:molybdopterin converting factor small subunit|nr:MoaD/ThiS family protein [Pseudomonadota bacterium]MBT5227011.1 MoaD/ThiS family protein [Pseudomonadota bacterium]MBT5817403.1 MoaD/ThiS family protein [Pseudomonadota bacterium]MBT6348542.1 MoaD/ThiS family protein [Pseudomonadota bacterium]MCH1521936.1 MoaD/ThiS family protein [Arenicellales bacterium]|tara:strand:+ start:1559 stop:1810 length:252 start_codon:yes stop_codon:yes gene_type:complete
MTITFKLYAGLSEHLPDHARRNSAEIELLVNETVDQLIDRQQVPRKDVHLVLVNGIYLDERQRSTHVLNKGDTLAIWPPVAGG